MALILKSNVRAENGVGNVHGWAGPQDYVAMLDFNRGEYFTISVGGRTDLSLAEAISLTRSSPGYYKGRDGVLRTANPNEPRIQYIDEYDMCGMCVDVASTNLALLGTNGETISFPAASPSPVVFLSFDGDGDASLTAADLTLTHSWTQIDGRKFKRYTRPTSAFSATLSVTGSATNIMVESTTAGFQNRVWVPYGETRAVERAALGAAIKSLLSGGDGSIIVRAIYYPAPAFTQTRTGNIVAVKSGVGQGGLYAGVSAQRLSNGTDSARSAADGASVNGAVIRASTNGNWRDQFIKGLTWADFGDSLGVITYGQYAYATDIGVTISGIDQIFVGGDTGSVSTTTLLGGVITHVIVYDRMLSVDEALLCANAGWF